MLGNDGDVLDFVCSDGSARFSKHLCRAVSAFGVFHSIIDGLSAAIC